MTNNDAAMFLRYTVDRQKTIRDFLYHLAKTERDAAIEKVAATLDKHIKELEGMQFEKLS